MDGESDLELSTRLLTHSYFENHSVNPSGHQEATVTRAFMLSHCIFFQPFNPVLSPIPFTCHYYTFLLYFYYVASDSFDVSFARSAYIMKHNEQHKYDKTIGEVGVEREVASSRFCGLHIRCVLINKIH